MPVDFSRLSRESANSKCCMKSKKVKGFCIDKFYSHIRIPAESIFYQGSPRALSFNLHLRIASLSNRLDQQRFAQELEVVLGSASSASLPSTLLVKSIMLHHLAPELATLECFSMLVSTWPDCQPTSRKFFLPQILVSAAQNRSIRSTLLRNYPLLCMIAFRFRPSGGRNGHHQSDLNQCRNKCRICENAVATVSEISPVSAEGLDVVDANLGVVVGRWDGSGVGVNVEIRDGFSVVDRSELRMRLVRALP